MKVKKIVLRGTGDSTLKQIGRETFGLLHFISETWEVSLHVTCDMYTRWTSTMTRSIKIPHLMTAMSETYLIRSYLHRYIEISNETS